MKNFTVEVKNPFKIQKINNIYRPILVSGNLKKKKKKEVLAKYKGSTEVKQLIFFTL